MFIAYVCNLPKVLISFKPHLILSGLEDTSLFTGILFHVRLHEVESEGNEKNHIRFQILITAAFLYPCERKM
jgi:hypothetical protein